MATLYLLPVPMSEAPVASVLPALNTEILASLQHFVVENVRSARRFIRRSLPDADINSMTFCELNRHTPIEEVQGFLTPLREGHDMGLMSDAGCPAIADPGALAVAYAQREGFRVVPLVGPSSILMSLMASGFNGQGFSFHGYLPIEEEARKSALKRYESESRRFDHTQIFIETPYRNMKLLRVMCETLDARTMICVASAITEPADESVVTRSAGAWREWLRTQEKLPEGERMQYDRRPSVFLLYAGEGEAVQQTKKSHRNNKKGGYNAQKGR